MVRTDRGQRRFPIAFLAVALVLAIPVAALVLKGVAMVLASLGIVMAFDTFTFVIFSVLLLPRIVGSLWAYFKVDNLWGNEVAYMAFFLWFPLIAAIFYGVTARNLRRPPRGYEWATIKNGVVHQPIFEYVGPAQTTDPSASHSAAPPLQPPQPPQQPYAPPQAYPPQGYQQQPQQPQQHPHQPQQQPQQPQQQPPQPQQQPQQPYQQPGQAQSGYSMQPYSPPGWQQPTYGQQPYPGPQMRPTTYPQSPPVYQQPYVPAPSPATGPGPEWKKVGERLVQKRDYLVWHNVVLLIMNAMLLAGFVLGLMLYPFIFSLDGFNQDAIVDIPTDATFVLFTLIIQDGILIWMVWHQVVRRRVIPLSEMGISKTELTDSSKMGRYSVIGIVFGLALFGLAMLIELGQGAIGFAPPDDAIIIGPVAGDLPSYLIWLISGCVIAPISEEFFFRGYAFYAFNKRYGLMVALFVSALGFSAIHGSIYALLPIFVAGVGLALAYHWTGSLVPPIIAHAVNNFLALTLMYIGFYG